MSGNVSAAQRELGKWRAAKFPEQAADPHKLLVQSIMGASEEVGELAHHGLKHWQGIREYHDFDWPESLELLKENAADAVGDVCLYLMGVCDALGLDLEEVIMETTRFVTTRSGCGATRED